MDCARANCPFRPKGTSEGAISDDDLKWAEQALSEHPIEWTPEMERGLELMMCPLRTCPTFPRKPKRPKKKRG